MRMKLTSALVSRRQFRRRAANECAAAGRSHLMRYPLGDVWGGIGAPSVTFRTGAFQFGAGEGVVISRPEHVGVWLGAGR